MLNETGRWRLVAQEGTEAHKRYCDELAALTAELKSLTEAYNNTDWKKKNDALTEVIKLAYRKHHLNDDSIGWEELSEALLNALCETIGDKGYQDWIDALKQGKEAGDELLKNQESLGDDFQKVLNEVPYESTSGDEDTQGLDKEEAGDE